MKNVLVRSFIAGDAIAAMAGCAQVKKPAAQVKAAFNAGANGYVTKGSAPSELIRAIRGIPAAGLTARYRCVAVLAEPGNGTDVLHAEGVCEGTLVTKPRGSDGFGYDPIFVPVGWDRTMAELRPEEKDRISHRGRAFRSLRELLERP